MRIDAPNNAAAAADADDAKLRQQAAKAAEKFEAFFIAQMLRQMRAGTRALADEDSPVRNKINEDMQDFADGQMADSLAGQRAFGIADVILRQLLPTPDKKV
ncbi:rod-binding protein [Roseateles violae]|uniref:Rod-binding protein n=1 Tax=Roseateles violae TaxID=3058042 RepID=A0ABT8DTB0_9BURK|nr:rod-binding protein [Pelomonas sp. PFR6]MDN3921549.1 rod-binding protein [Pelomonas sp. PFR6]